MTNSLLCCLVCRQVAVFESLCLFVMIASSDSSMHRPYKYHLSPSPSHSPGHYCYHKKNTMSSKDSSFSSSSDSTVTSMFNSSCNHNSLSMASKHHHSPCGQVSISKLQGASTIVSRLVEGSPAQLLWHHLIPQLIQHCTGARLAKCCTYW